jgi:hypothetical protein
MESPASKAGLFLLFRRELSLPADVIIADIQFG